MSSQSPAFDASCRGATFSPSVRKHAGVPQAPRPALVLRVNCTVRRCHRTCSCHPTFRLSAPLPSPSSPPPGEAEAQAARLREQLQQQQGRATALATQVDEAQRQLAAWQVGAGKRDEAAREG